MITIGSWYYFTYCHVYVGEVDYKPAPIDPEELKAYEIEIFREYLRIPTVHPNVNYGRCIKTQNINEIHCKNSNFHEIL